MKEYLQKFKDWWSTLAIREKKAVSIGGAALGVFILYQGIWSPYLHHVATERQRISSQQKLLLWMQATDKEMQKMQGQSTGQNQGASPVLFLSYMQKQVRQAGLAKALVQMQEVSSDSIEAHFQQVDFDRLMTLMMTMMKEQRVSVTQFTSTAEGAPGMVNVDLVLKLG
jgi:general secretion pathway protein M